MTLPLVISVPHAGLDVPGEVVGRSTLSEEEIAADGDVGAREIYDVADSVAAHVTTPVARAFVDLNRAPDDRSRDGVVKTHTCWDVPVYSTPLEEPLILELLSRYHRPYHSRLESLGTSRRFLAGVDCHTMAAEGPPVGPDPGRQRPRVCLGSGRGAFPSDWIALLHRCFVDRFGDDVTVDEPFAGGYITERHGAEMPWVQIEMSRAGFMPNSEKKCRVVDALAEFVRRVPQRRP